MNTVTESVAGADRAAALRELAALQREHTADTSGRLRATASGRTTVW